MTAGFQVAPEDTGAVLVLGSNAMCGADVSAAVMWGRRVRVLPHAGPHPALQATFSQREKDTPSGFSLIWTTAISHIAGGHRPPLQFEASELILFLKQGSFAALASTC